MRMKKYVYKYSAFGRMRDRIERKEKGKGKSKVPYKTIMWAN